MWLKKVEYKEANWEEIPQEDLWQDGEITSVLDLMHEIEQRVLVIGDWKLIRRKNENRY